MTIAEWCHIQPITATNDNISPLGSSNKSTQVAGIATLPTNFFSSILVQSPSLYNDAYSKVKAVGSMYLPVKAWQPPLSVSPTYYKYYNNNCCLISSLLKSFWLLILINLSILGLNYNCFTHYLVPKIVIAIRYLTCVLTFGSSLPKLKIMWSSHTCSVYTLRFCRVTSTGAC